jgi:hypothetical protein
MEREINLAGETITETFDDILSDPEAAFGYGEYVNNPDLLEQFENNRMSLKDDVDFISDVKDDFVDNNSSMDLDDDDIIIVKDDKNLAI